MKLRTVVTFHLGPEDLERVTPELESLLPGKPFEEGAYEVGFERGEPGLEELLLVLGHLGLEHEVMEERRFRRREIEEACALHISPEPPPSGGGLERESTDYDLEEACPLCGTGRQQVGDLVVEEVPEGEHGLAVTPGGNLVVSESVARELVSRRISGCLLRAVRDPWGQRLDWFQLMPVHTLPPMQRPPTRFEVDPGERCPLCGAGGVTLTSMLYYDAPTEEFEDVNVSAESFGRATDLAQEVVVSQRLFRLLVEHGTSGLRVEPVVLV